MAVLLADAWRDLKVGAWFRVKTATAIKEDYTDKGLREKGAGFCMLAVQQCIGGRSEWENWERTEGRQTRLVGQEILEVGGADIDCDVYEMESKAGKEKAWIALDGAPAGAPVRWESPAVVFVARALATETLTLGSKTFDCVKMEGEETAGGKKAAATRWWSPLYPMGPIKSVSGPVTIEAVKAGDDWTKRPPFPS